jgi:hypothetical protein
VQTTRRQGDIVNELGFTAGLFDGAFVFFALANHFPGRVIGL